MTEILSILCKCFSLAENLYQSGIIQDGTVGTMKILVDPETIRRLSNPDYHTCGMLFIWEKGDYEKIKNELEQLLFAQTEGDQEK